MTTLSLNGLSADCIIGERPDERTRLQRLDVDVDLALKDDRAGETDDLADAVDYATLAQKIRQALVDAKCMLVERAARIVAETCLADAKVASVAAKVVKKGAVAGLGSAAATCRLSRIAATVLALVAIAGGASAAAEENGMRDDRTRTYLWPVRVVWANGPVEKADRLLGSVPEKELFLGHWRNSGCVLNYDGTGTVSSVLLDFGREIHGSVQISTGWLATKRMRVRMRLGESVGEAMSEFGEKNSQNAHSVRDSEIELPPMGAREIGESGFRFVRIDLLTKGRLILDAVRAVSIMRQMPRIGSFSSSDERLNAVYETAVRTVHLCCQDFLWDGIKRDRLVWMGDTYPETMAILANFGAAKVLPESLDHAMAVTPVGNDMNGIRNYTLWWVRNMAAWYLYTGDTRYVAGRRDYLAKTLAKLSSYVSPSNTFDGGVRPFLDWPTQSRPDSTRNGSNALAAMTFDDGAMMMRAIGDSALAAKCEDAARRLRSVRNEPLGTKQSAALLALSGMRNPKEMFAEELGQRGHRGVSTFYGYFMIEAMSEAGEQQRALDTVRDYWGAMLDVGATSFWEDFNLAWTNNCTRIDEMPVKGKHDIHGDYGDHCYVGFRHSLCHGWSAGPAAWCINRVLGIRPLSVGCRKVEVKPNLSDLKWAEGAMALPGGGAVKVRAERRGDGSVDVKVDAPSWVTVVR